MFGSEVLDVAIGIIFVFILVSVICSAIREGIESILKTRAAFLEHGIRQLLNDMSGTGLAKDLYEHPLIFGLFPGPYKPSGGGDASSSTEDGGEATPSAMTNGGNLPSYIPSRNFALALMDMAARGVSTAQATDVNTAAISLDTLRQNVNTLGDGKIQRVLLTAIDSAEGDLNKVRENLEAWYNSSMDRVSGWYKRSTHRILFMIGFIVAVVMNINTITIADYLYRNDAARAAVVASAGAAVENKTPITYEGATEQFKTLSLPIGWNQKFGWEAVKFGLMGWLFTALAATLGAPFWFDVLNKVMVIRSTVKPHEKSPEEGSEDRQSRKQQMTLVVQGAQESTDGTGSSKT